MPNMKNAKKKVRVIEKKTAINNEYEASMKNTIKTVEKAITAKDKDKASNSLKTAITRIDKATKAGVVTKNCSARNKSRLTKKVNNMEI